MSEENTAENERITDEEVFRAAVEMVQNMPKDGDVAISNTDKLEFYSLFKQATLGRCNTPRPAIWNVVDRYKWDAWSALGSMETNMAREKYVHKFKEVMDRVLESRSIAELLKDERWAHLRPVIEPRFDLINRALNGPSTPTVSEIASTRIAPSSTSQEEHSVMLSSASPSPSSAPPPPPLVSDHAVESGAFSTDEDEYADAPDSPVLVDSTDVFPSSNLAPNDPVTNTIRSEIVAYVQTTTQVISQQIQVLGRTLKKHNALIQKFLDAMNRNRSHNRWPFLLLLFIWPIIVQLGIRFFFRQSE